MADNYTKTPSAPQPFRKLSDARQQRNISETEQWDDNASVVWFVEDITDTNVLASATLSMDVVVGSPVACLLEIEATDVVEWAATASKSISMDILVDGAVASANSQARIAIPVTTGTWRMTLNGFAVVSVAAGLHTVTARFNNGGGNAVDVVTQSIKVRRGRPPAA